MKIEISDGEYFAIIIGFIVLMIALLGWYRMIFN
jgi:hypothetical protein